MVDNAISDFPCKIQTSCRTCPFNFLYFYYIEHVDELPDDIIEIAKEEGANVASKDYVAGMTDRFAINKYEELR